MEFSISSIIHSAKKISCFIFHIIGILLAIYFVSMLILQYEKNEDKSSFYFQKYHTSKEHKYPTFSICFDFDLRYPDTFYQSDIINETLHIEASDYYNMLLGETTGLTNFSLLQYDEAKWDLRIMVSRYIMVDYKQNWLHDWNDSFNTSDLPFFVGYQDPSTICITRNDTFYPKNSIYSEFVSLDTTNWLGDLKMYIHYSGQLMTKLNRHPTIFVELSDSPVIIPSYTIGISQMQLLKKRPDSYISCNPDHGSTVDTRWLKSFMITSNCIPTYWILLDQSINHEDGKLNECTKSQEYDNLSDILYGNDEIQYEQSCTWPTILTDMKREFNNVTGPFFDFWITYESEYYLEVRNSKEINNQDLWSQSGGLIGIFLGYSILQIPHVLFSLLSAVLAFVNNLKNHMS